MWRNNMSSEWAIPLSAFTFMVLAGVGVACGQSYRITEIETLGGNQSRPLAINDAGVVAGQARDQMGRWQSFLWQEGGLPQMIPPLPTHNSGAAGGLSGADPMQVCGVSVSSSQGERLAYLWVDGTVTDIHDFPTRPQSQANAVNDAGFVVGIAHNAGLADARAFVWDASNGMVDITPDGSSEGWPNGINAAGYIVGSAGTFANWPAGPAQAVIWEQIDGVWAVTHELGALFPGISEGTAINDAEPPQIAGFSITEDETRHAFVWSQKQGAIDPGVLPDYQHNRAEGLNDAGRVVGWSFNGGYLSLDSSAWVWHDGTQHDLNDLVPNDPGWLLHEAWDINEAGQIVGRGRNPDGDVRGYLLTPCLADVTGDGVIDVDDLIDVITNWGLCGSCPADIDDDGDVDVDDLLAVIMAWGPCE